MRLFYGSTGYVSVLLEKSHVPSRGLTSKYRARTAAQKLDLPAHKVELMVLEQLLCKFICWEASSVLLFSPGGVIVQKFETC